MGQAAGQAAAPRTIYTAKGGGSVNGFPCTKYEGMRGAEKVADLCAAKPADVRFNASDFQVIEKMREFGSNMLSALANSPLGNSRVADLMQPGYDGLPVQQTNYSGGQAISKWEVKSIERVSFSDADFSLGNAKKVDLIPGRR